MGVKPKRIIIIRHGQSESNLDRARRSAKIRATIPDWKIQLTPKGHKQAKSVGKKLNKFKGKFAVWHSPYLRSLQTTNDLVDQFDAGKIVYVRSDPRIREQDWGHLREEEETKRIDAERDAFSRFWYRIPDGESGADVFDRISTFLETLHRDFLKADHPDNLIISTHGYTSRIIVMRWLHQSVEDFETMKNPPNCGYYVLELQANDRYKLVRDPWT